MRVLILGLNDELAHTHTRERAEKKGLLFLSLFQWNRIWQGATSLPFCDKLHHSQVERLLASEVPNVLFTVSSLEPLCLFLTQLTTTRESECTVAVKGDKKRRALEGEICTLAQNI